MLFGDLIPLNELEINGKKVDDDENTTDYTQETDDDTEDTTEENTEETNTNTN